MIEAWGLTVLTKDIVKSLSMLERIRSVFEAACSNYETSRFNQHR